MRGVYIEHHTVRFGAGIGVRVRDKFRVRVRIRFRVRARIRVSGVRVSWVRVSVKPPFVFASIITQVSDATTGRALLGQGQRHG